MNLRRMLLAHHERYEWGSPRRPSGEAWTTYDRLLGRQLYAGEDAEK